MLLSDLQPAITKICCDPTFIPHTVSAIDEVIPGTYGPVARRVFRCEILGIGAWSDPDADMLFHRVCRAIIYHEQHKCPECGATTENGVCQSAACKTRLM
jgi:hypothetical protein